MEWFVLVTALIGKQPVSVPIWKFYETREICQASIQRSILPYRAPRAKFECKKGYPI